MLLGGHQQSLGHLSYETVVGGEDSIQQGITDVSGQAAIIDLSRGVPFRWVSFLGAVWAEKAEEKAIETGRTGKPSR